MARWVDATVVLVLLGVVMAGQQCMSVKARELVDTNMLIKAGLSQQAQRDVDLAAMLAAAAAATGPSKAFVTTFNVTILLRLIAGESGDGKTFIGTGSRGAGSGSGLLFQSSSILDTTSFEVLPANSSSSTLRTITFSNAEGDVVGTWLGALTSSVQLVPASTGSGTFTATTTTTTTTTT